MIYIKKFLSKVVKYVRPQYFIFSKVRTCKCCGKKSLILRLNAYDEFTRCIRCTANLRYEHLAEAIYKQDELENKKIVEMDDRSPLKILLDKYPGYLRTYFSEQAERGKISENGARCEDVTNMTFEDNSIDILISSDVLEHVSDLDKAFAETQRVLKPGGKHIFTVPMYEGTTKRRAKLIDGDVVNYLPPEYHCDPEADGSGYILAFWNFGTDLATKYSNSNLKLSVIDGPFGKEGKMVWCAEKIS